MNAGMWPLLNSAGRCSAATDQTGARCRPELGAQQPVVGRLHGLDVLGVPPHHEVGVGAQPGDVVDAADDDALPLDLGEQRLDLGRDLGAVLRRAGSTP